MYFIARRTSPMGIWESSVIFLSGQKRENASLISDSWSAVMLCSFARAERRPLEAGASDAGARRFAGWFVLVSLSEDLGGMAYHFLLWSSVLRQKRDMFVDWISVR